MKRNQTNQLMKAIASTVEEIDDSSFLLTILVDGQIITGTVISEDQYFGLEENEGLKDYFHENIKGLRNKIIESLDNGEDVEFPEEIKEYFLYLKDAFYINGLTRFPAGENGLSIQVRISDISAYSSVGFNGNSTEETLATYEKL